jgi:hypothetical protein
MVRGKGTASGVIVRPDPCRCGKDPIITKRVIYGESVEFYVVCLHCGRFGPEENTRPRAARAWALTVRGYQGGGYEP